jgi:hypothetical protein
MKRYIYILIAFLSLLFVLSFQSLACAYSVVLWDEYGDGWNGGSLTINVNGIPVLTGLTVTSGYGPAAYQFQVSHGDVISTTYTAGSWPSENYYYIYNQAGVEVYSDGLFSTVPLGGYAGLGVCPDHDLAVVEWKSPALGCDLSSEYVGFVITNFGTFPESNFQVAWSMDGGTTFTTETITDTLLPGDSLEHTFTSPATIGTYGVFEFMGVVNLSSDQWRVNDTLIVSFRNTPIINTFPYIQDWDGTGPHYWSPGGQNSSWQLGIPSGVEINTAYTAPNVWATGLSTPYNVNEVSWVESPCFDFSTLINPYVQFAYACKTDYGDDGAAFQYTTDGINWYHVGQAYDPNNWFNTDWVDALLAFGNREGWTSSVGQWNVALHDLAFLVGEPSVKFRFVFASDQQQDPDDGFAFDFFSIFQPPFMAFDTLEVSHDDTSDIGQGQPNVQILKVNVVTTGETSPINVTDWYFNTGGMKALSDIDSARLYFTEDAEAFATWWQVGDAVRPAGPFSFQDNIVLGEGNNYFWLAYDLLPGAVPGNAVDASLDSVAVDDTARGPVNGNPTGQRTILSNMAGTYVIDHLGTGDYLSFTEAVDDLLRRGVSDSVTFLVKPGSYTEQILITEVYGASAAHPITFRSYTGDNSSVTLRYVANKSQYLPSNNAVLMLWGADWITFKAITIMVDLLTSKGPATHALVIGNDATNNRFIDNNFVGIATTSTSTEYAVIYSDYYNDNNTHFINNTISNGSYGLYLYGASYYGNEQGTLIQGNLIQNFVSRGIFLGNHNGAQVLNNQIISNPAAGYVYCIYLYYCNGDNLVDGNQIQAYGVSGLYGMYIYGNTGLTKGMTTISNNFITAMPSGTISGRGIYVSNSLVVLIANNSINTYYNHTNAACVDISGLEYIYLANNILNENGIGYALYIARPEYVDSSDYNVLKTNGTRLAYLQGATYTDIAAWKTTGFDAHSYTTDPGFLSATDLHTLEIAIDGRAVPIPGITHDIDGDLRDLTNPDPGADEFDPPPFEAGLLGITSPVTACGLGMENITIAIHNRGTSTISGGLTAGFSINGQAGTSTAVSGSIAPGDTFLFAFPSAVDLTASIGDTTFMVSAWINLAGDPNQSNDSSSTIITSRYQPAAPVTTDDIVSFGQSGTLTAAPVYPVYWYASPTSEGAIAQGDTFVTPVRYDTTTYYAAYQGPGGDMKITEVVVAFTGTGYTNPYPPYFPTSNFNGIELTNLGSGPAYLDGYRIQLMGYVNFSWNFPDGIILAPGETMTLIHYATTAVQNDPANRLYVMATNQYVYQYSATGYVLYDEDENIVDVVATYSYNFPNNPEIIPQHWSGNLSGGYAGVSRSISDNNNSGDWYLPSTSNPQTFGSLNPGLGLGTGAGCFSLRSPATVYVINIPPLGEPSLSTNNLHATINDCDDSLQLPVIITNVGDSILDYSLSQAQVKGYDSTSRLDMFNATGFASTHTFHNLSVSSDSVKLMISFAGDFDSQSEYLEMYIDGQYMGQINDLNLATSAVNTFEFTFTGTVVAGWLADQQITVILDNNSSVGWGYTNEFHQVRLIIPGTADWLSLPNISGSLAIGASTTVYATFHSNGLNNGTYHSEFPITFNNPGMPRLDVLCTLTVNGLPEVSLDPSCLHFGSLMQYTSAVDSFEITNTGCDILIIDSLICTDTSYQVWPIAGVLFPNQGMKVFVEFSPLQNTSYPADVLIYTNVQDTNVCLSGDAFSPPRISLNPDSLYAILQGCNDSTLLTFSITNLGDTTLSYQVNGAAGTPAPAGCIPQTTGTCCGMGIWRVQFNGIDHYTNGGTDGYQDYTATQSSVVEPGQTYPIHIETGTSYNEHVRVWIDYNDNGSFETNEMVLESVNQYVNHNGSVTIPYNISTSTPLRMRVGSEYNGNSVPGPCTNVTYGQFEDYTIQVRSGAYTGANSGNLAPQASATIDVWFKAMNLYSGQYSGGISITSNDPLNPQVFVKTHLQVIGAPEISLNEDSLTFDSLMIGATQEQMLTVYNTGCSTLAVSSISSTSQHFTAQPTSLSIPPGTHDHVYITFSPLATGMLSGTIQFANNAQNIALNVAGVGLPAPNITVDPDTLDVVITGCNDSLTVNLTVTNTGTANLEYLVRSTTGTVSLDTVLSRFKSNAALIRSMVPSSVAFNEGVTGSSINDGINDMYDGGNYINTNYLNSIVYSDNVIRSSNAFGTGSQYFTRKETGLWLLAADLKSISWFEITGNLGADGYGSVDGSVIEMTVNGVVFQGFIKRVFSAGDPSVNHLIMVEKKPGISHTFASNTDNDQHRVSGLDGSERLYYLLYAGTSGLYIPDNTVANIMRTFLEAVNPSPAWLVVSPEGDTVVPTANSVVTATFYSELLVDGTYNAAIEFISNDPDQALLRVPVTLTVNGQAQIAYTPNALDFGNTMQGTGAQLPIWIYNDGCANLVADSIWTTLPGDFDASLQAFTIAPNDSLMLEVDFSPSVNGPLSANLRIRTNIGTYTIPLSGVGVPEPIIGVDPASFNVTIPSCDDTLFYPLTIRNTGMGDLIFNMFGGFTSFYDETSYIAYSNTAAQTQHTFTGIPTNADSIFVTVTINGDFDDGSEYATLYVEGQSMGIIVDNNVYNNTDIVRTYGFGYPQIAPWINDGIISVMIQNSSQVNAFNGDGNFHRVRMVVNAAPWLGISTSMDTVPSGDSVQLNVAFISTGINARTYYSSIVVNSNDPYTPVVSIPCTLNVTGPAGFVLADSCLEFGTVLVGNSLDDTTIIFNPGCDSLTITGVNISHPDFSIISYPSFILPRSQGNVIARFSPSSVGTYAELASFQTNIGNHSLCLNGVGAAPPVLEYAPTSLTGNITVCHDTLSEWLAISNSGVEDLIYNLLGDDTDSVRVLALRYGDNSTIFNNVIAALNLNFPEFELTESTTTSASTLASLLNGKDLVLFTRFTVSNPSVFSAFAPVLQNFVNQGGVVLFVGIYDASYSQNMYATGLFSGNYNSYVTGGMVSLSTSDPLATGMPANIPANSYVFNHIFTNPDLVRVGTYSGLDAIAYREYGAGRVIYLGYDFYNYSPDAGVILGRAVASATSGGLPDWLSANPMHDTVASGDTSWVKVTFDAQGLVSGSYTGHLLIGTNVPGSNGDSIPVTLNLSGYPIVTVPAGIVDIGSVMIGGSLTGTSNISNTGCDALSITGLTHTDPEFTVSLNDYSLQPGESATLTHIFQPTVTGVHIDTIRLSSAQGIVEYLVKGTALSAPELEINPSSLTVAITGCDDSTSAMLQLINGGNAPLNWTMPAEVTTNHALVFDGINDYVNLGSWNAGAIWTLEAWVNPASAMIGQRTIVGGVHQCANWAITVKDGMFALVIKPQTALCSHTATSTVQAVPGVWYHVAAVNTGTQARLYVNGNLAATASISPYYLGTASGVQIGGEYCCYGNSFHGTIDEVRIWKVARTQSQIRANMYNLLTGDEANLEGYWPMNEGSGGTIFDRGNMAHHGSIYGPVWTNQVWNDDWLVSVPSSGSVSANDTAMIKIEFYSAGLYTGTFLQTLLIETDDPLHPLVSIPCTMNVTGEAEMQLQPLCIYYNATMQYAQSTGQVFITNSGCDTLFVSSAVSTNPAFTPAQSGFSVLPGYTYPLTVTFAPTTTGIILGDLVLTTSIGPGTVCLNGTAIDRPVANLQGTSFFGQPACDFRDTAHIILENLGAAPLNVGYTLTPVVSWGDLISTPAVVAPFGQTTLSFVFNKTGLSPGNYSTTLILATNDPLNPSLSIPVQMNVPNVLAPVNLGRDTGSCVGLSITLNAGAGYSSYNWSTGSTGNLTTVNTPGTYSVTVTDAFGCVSSDQVYAGFYPYPVAFAGNDTSVCTNYSLTLSGSASGLSQAQPTDIVIGTGTDYTTNITSVPFKTYFMDGRTQMMYTRQELKAAGFDAGPITSLGFKVGTPGSIPMQNFSIHMTTTGSTFISGFQAMGPLVYYSSSYQAVPGWNMFSLINPFYWDGNSNIIVEVCFDNSNFSGNSSMEYTVVSSMVWGAGCDDCAPGCALNGGSSSTYRVNMRIIGENDPSTYWWTGPANYTANYKQASINNLQAGNGGVYTFHVDNGWGCVGTDQLTLSVLPTPVAEAGVPDTILEGTSTQLNGSATGGVTPYSYMWSPPFGLSDPAIANPTATPAGDITYVLNVTGANGCANTDQVRIRVLPIFDITGRLFYSNQSLTGLANVEIQLNKTGQGAIDTAITGSDGSFDLIAAAGNYGLIPAIHKAWGGVNATDALMVARHAVFLTQLNGLPLKAGDVNFSGSVNATDALMIMRRFVGYVNSFAAGDWLTDQASSFNLTIDRNFDIPALCVGDVDGSYVPGKEAPNFVKLHYTPGGIRIQKITEIPIFISQSELVGAISMELILPECVGEVIEVNSPFEGLIFRQEGSRLRIAWQESGGTYLASDQLLLSLRCTMVSEASLAGQLSLGQANEFADPEGRVIKAIDLYTQPLVSAKDGPMLGKNFPDPFDRLTYIPFDLPAEMSIVIELHDVLGRPVSILANGLFGAGSHLLPFDGSHLNPGIYFYTLKTGGLQGYQETYKMIISR